MYFLLLAWFGKITTKRNSNDREENSENKAFIP